MKYAIGLSLSVAVCLAVLAFAMWTGSLSGERAQEANRVEAEREYRWTVRTIGGLR